MGPYHSCIMLMLLLHGGKLFSLFSWRYQIYAAPASTSQAAQLDTVR